jgi:hypothetical protein
MYHLSGRRVRAASNSTTTTTTAQEFVTQESAIKASRHDAMAASATAATTNESTVNHHASPSSSSFTTARSCRAIVPGLEIISEYHQHSDSNNSKNPKGRFKQKCFHCGEKGHSYKWCPTAQETIIPTETIDLS